MLYSEFLKKIDYPEERIVEERESWSSRKLVKRAYPTKIEIRWSTGGMTGGSCWDDSSPHPYCSSDTEPDFTELDEILGTVCPNISYLQYKRVTNGLIHSDSETENEYYGNCTNYAIKYVVLKELYDRLCEVGVLE